MQIEKPSIAVTKTSRILTSAFLEREVEVDLYFPPGLLNGETLSLLLINDGQDLPAMSFETMLESLYAEGLISPVLCVGVHCGKDRKNEYGTAGILNYKGLGVRAGAYTSFIVEELLPFIRKECSVPSFKDQSFCGFSLGGLSAFDIVWHHPEVFRVVGAFSGSFWWRTVAQEDPGFEEDSHRIMHGEIRKGRYYPWLKFFFETGTLDETADRNRNGIIDSIDDTLSLIGELEKKGYQQPGDIRYLEVSNGKHDVATWGKAFPVFLVWGWPKDRP